MLAGILKVVFIMILGGIIAFVGDQVGRRLGRKRITIFNLRPRYTSMIFTVIFGMLISLVTIAILSIASKDARTALFGMQKLEEERQRLVKQIVQLTNITTLGQLVFHVNQPIITGVIEGGQPKDVIKNRLSELLARANQIAIMKSNEVARLRKQKPISDDQVLVVHLQEDFEKAVKYLSNSSKSQVVIIYSIYNTFLQNQVFVKFDFLDNKLIFRKDEVITTSVIDGRNSREEILVELFQLFSKLQNVAIQEGMIPDPIKNNFGGNILIATLLDKSDQIKATYSKVEVKVLANRDIYTVSPMDVRLVLEPQKD